MKTVLKIMGLVSLVMAALCISCVSVSYGVENNEERKYVEADNSSEVKEQSVLLIFLYNWLLLETLAEVVDGNHLCDICEMREYFDFKLIEGVDIFKELGMNDGTSSSSQGLSSIFEELGLNEGGFLGSGKKVGKKCNLCELLNELPFRDLRNVLFNKLGDLYDKEYPLFAEEVGDFAEPFYQLLDGFEYKSEKDLEHLDTIYTKTYEKVEKMGNTPNLLNQIAILRLVSKATLEFVEKMKGEDEIVAVHLILTFAAHLMDHKTFIDDNSEILFEVESIMNDDFNIKNFSEIMTEVERRKSARKLNVSNVEKDLL